MLLQFTKMHGLGNDFVLLDLISQQLRLNRGTVKRLADRRLGIGFDQLLTVEPPGRPELDFRFTIYNADGSQAEQCGNGARCCLSFVRAQGLTTRTQIKLETSNGVIACHLEKDGKVTVDMGCPVLQPDKIPFIAGTEAPVIEGQPGIQYQLSLPPDADCGSKTVRIAALNMGNPHAVIEVQDIDAAPVQELGSVIQRHASFPEQVNVGFMKVLRPDKIRLRVLERGAGETRACGSGACAAVVAGRLAGLLNEVVDVVLPGGSLTIHWPGGDAPVMMTGPVSWVYEGKLQI